MKTRYTAESLAREIDAFERRYGIKTKDLAEMECIGPESVDPFDRAVWLDAAEELERLSHATIRKTRVKRRSRPRRVLQPAS
jgi:hypothetical protein